MIRKFVAGLLALSLVGSVAAQNIRISDLPSASALSGSEVAPWVQSSATVKVTANQVQTFAHIGTQPLDSDLTAIAALTTTSAGRDLLTSADAAGIRTKAAAAASGVNTDITSITGSAAKWTTARNIAGNSVDGSANVAFTNKFIVQGTTDSGLSSAQFLGALSTGLLKNTTTTGVLSIGAAATDYVVPSAYASANGMTMATNKLLGRTTASTGAAEEISIGTGLSMSGGTLTSTGTGGTVTSVAALTLGTTGTDLTSSVATGTTTPVITLNVPTASASNRGVLSSTDWSTFNGKQVALSSGTNIKTVGGVSLLGSGDLGTIGVGYGGSGAITLTGYIKGNGTSAFTASTTVPNTDISGLGTISTQAANSVSISGGTIDGTAIGGSSASTGKFTSIQTSSFLGVGAAASASYNILVGFSLTGGSTARSISSNVEVQSDVTSTAIGMHSKFSTHAAAFTLNSARYFFAEQGTIGSGSAINSQAGYWASSSIIGAAANYQFYAENAAAIGTGNAVYGFYSGNNIATGGGIAWAFYGNGTAPSLLNGSLSTKAYIANGSVPTPTGSCAINTQVGGNTAGSFKANGACVAGTVILTFATTATTGWACHLTDMTTTADAMIETAYSTTSVTLTGSMANSDQIIFQCMAF